MIGIKFGSFDMQANGCRVIRTDVYSPPANDIQADSLAERDGVLITQQRLKSKPFKVEGLLRASTRSAVEQLRDTFLAAMSQKNQAFDIDYNGSTRRYLASAENIMLTDTSLTTFAFTVSFLCPDGVGWDIDSSTLISAIGVTTSVAGLSLTVGGTYMASPSILLVINTMTGAATNTISIGNGSTLRTMSVTRAWAASDRLEVNSLTGTVYVNSIATDYKGQLPTFAPGAGSLSYLDDFSARSVTISASYAKRWL